MTELKTFKKLQTVYIGHGDGSDNHTCLGSRIVLTQSEYDELLVKSKEQGGWISVQKQLPKEYSIISATDGNNHYKCEYKLGRFYRFVDSIISQDRIMSIYHEDITHWQPLPTNPS